jgi:HD-like signal output (HDOD) protein
MNSILFVDDETKVLEGLCRMLRGLRRQWNMEFAEGGQRALECLAKTPFDVVVTDMRMPGMDGSELLTEVARLYPATVRIILSGQCDRPTVLKAVGPSHQFLTKPCDSESLKATVAKACKLRDRLTNDALRQLASRTTAVPTLPHTYWQILAELESPSASMQHVSELIAQDVGMSAKVLQLTSSGFFGTPQRISDPRRAASLFDLETIRALFTTTETFCSPFDVAEPLQGCPLEYMVAHCLTVAENARAIAAAEGCDAGMVEDAYLAGLLHDVGILVLARHMPERYLEYLSASELQRTPIWKMEGSDFNATHADIGGYLLALWGLPDAVVDATAWHHTPSSSDAREFGPLTAVHVADALSHDAFAEQLGLAEWLDLAHLERLGTTHRLDRWRELCRANTRSGAIL